MLQLVLLASNGYEWVQEFQNIEQEKGEAAANRAKAAAEKKDSLNGKRIVIVVCFFMLAVVM